jgi:hypothetical protein
LKKNAFKLKVDARVRNAGVLEALVPQEIGKSPEGCFGGAGKPDIAGRNLFSNRGDR